MENASKALLIAGAILIVILLIGVGMLVFNGAQESIEGSLDTMSAQEIQAFNSQFSSYEGSVKGSSVRSLIQKVIASNSSNTYGRYIGIDGTAITSVKAPTDASTAATAATNMSKQASALTTTTKYTISFEYNADGTINKVVIDK